MWIAPPGCRRITVFDEASLIAFNWRKTTISKVFTPVMNNENKFLRRFSYPIKNYVASTIHKCLGDTLPKIVTKISLTESSYKIWEKEQLLVLLSRVSKLDDITFIGREDDLEATIASVLQKPSCWSNYIQNLLDKIVSVPNAHAALTLDLLSSNFVAWNVILPEDDIGFVFLLVSRKITHVYYIGETIGIRRELKKNKLWWRCTWNTTNRKETLGSACLCNRLHISQHE